MKITAYDSEMLRNLGPLEMIAYLRSQGWRQTTRLGERGSVWRLVAANGDEFEIVLPLDRGLRDYALSMGEALRTLESVEARSGTEILRDITTSSADIIRVRLQHGLAENGTLPLKYGMQALQKTYDLLLAAACAAIHPRAFYPPRKPQQALQYMSGLRLGQTEQGSYVLTLQSPVPPLLGLQEAPETRETAPFARRVTLALAEALAALQEAITQAGATGDIKPFEDAIASGVSVNLCEALVGLGLDATVQEVAFQISWSPNRQVPPETPNRFQFTSDTLPLLREAARLLEDAPSSHNEEVAV